MSRTATKKAVRKLPKEVVPVNQITPGNRIVLKIQETPEGPVQEIKIDKTKRIQDESGSLERIVMIESLLTTVERDRKNLKHTCFMHGAKYIESPHAVGQIIGSGEGGKINIDKFLKLMKDRKIAPEKYLPALRVTKDDCTFLSEDDITAISDFPEVPPEPKFQVAVRKDVVPVPLTEAVNRIVQYAQNGQLEPAK